MTPINLCILRIHRLSNAMLEVNHGVLVSITENTIVFSLRTMEVKQYHVTIEAFRGREARARRGLSAEQVKYPSRAHLQP